MAVTNTYGREVVTTYKRWASCCPSVYVQTSENLRVSLVQTDRLPRESRPKPDDLGRNVTPRARQYTSVEKYSRHAKVKTTPIQCGYNGPRCTMYEEYSAVGPGKPYIPPLGDPNWALAIRNKIQDDKVSFAESIGEWKELCKLTTDTVGVLTRAYREAKALLRTRGNRRRMVIWFKRLFKRRPDSKYELMDAVSLDLAIKFGIKPNLDLMWDTMAQLDKVLKRFRRIQVTLRSEYEGAVSGYPDLTCKRYRSVRAIAFVRYDMENREFTSGNLAEALWAGLPLSFVIDWFWNVGSYLSSFNAMKGIDELIGVKCTREFETYHDMRRYSDYSLKTAGLYQWRSYQRDVFTSIPFPDVPMPSLPSSDILSRLWTTIEIFLSLRRKR